jgi:hypothetical protein
MKLFALLAVLFAIVSAQQVAKVEEIPTVDELVKEMDYVPLASENIAQ